MPCCKGLSQIALRNIFRNVRCLSACCGRKIVIQSSDIDGGEISKSRGNMRYRGMKYDYGYKSKIPIRCINL